MTGPGDVRFAIPGVETGVVGHPRFASVERVGTNAWVATTHVDPDGDAGAVGVGLRLEHDTCGAWVTLRAAGGPRPFVLRRAGWCDLRGHPTPAEDRVGLGPGDALVLPAPGVSDRRDSSDTRYGGDPLATVLLRSVDESAEDVAFRCWSAAQRFERVAPGVEAVAVLRVPADAAVDPVARVASATGVAAEELDLPGYPVGDSQPELWHRPPLPPRAAWLLLAPEATEVAGVRGLLQRLLASWRLDALVDADDVTLLASELATNAVRHARTESMVAVRWLGDRLRLEVEDASTELPARRTPGGDGPGGWGLELMEQLASRWGVERTRRGKRVWFELRT